MHCLFILVLAWRQLDTRLINCLQDGEAEVGCMIKGTGLYQAQKMKVMEYPPLLLQRQTCSLNNDGLMQRVVWSQLDLSQFHSCVTPKHIYIGTEGG